MPVKKHTYTVMVQNCLKMKRTSKNHPFETNAVKNRPINDDIHQLFDEMLGILKEHNVKEDFVTS